MENEVKPNEQQKDSDGELECRGEKPYWFLMKRKDGSASVSLTMAWWSFILVSLMYVLNAFPSVHGIMLKGFDPAATSMYFITCCGLYFGRKFTDRQK